MSLCTAFVTTFAGLCVARAFLGLAEGGTMPGIAFYLSTFYRRGELLFRIGIFVSASSLAGAFGKSNASKKGGHSPQCTNLFWQVDF